LLHLLPRGRLEATPVLPFLLPCPPPFGLKPEGAPKGSLGLKRGLEGTMPEHGGQVRA
jgi:hypothetical protein